MNALTRDVVVLETERLLLERWDEERLGDFVRLAGDRRVTGQFGDGQPWTGERSEARFAEALGHWSRYGFGWRSAIERESGDWIGFVGLNYSRPEAIELPARSVEIGWWLDPVVWGRGLATEGATALRDEGFERVGLDRLWARYQTANRASARVAEKIGLRPDHVAVGRHGDAVQLASLTKEQWAATRRD